MKQVIFAGCDSYYWKLYGKSFVKSFKSFNPDKVIHIHLINPDAEDLTSIKELPCDYSVEYITEDTFKKVSNTMQEYLENNADPIYKKKIITGLKFCKQETLKEKINFLSKFSLFAISRFIKLNDLEFHQVLSYDIDSICLGKIDIDAVLDGHNIGSLKNKKNGCVASLIAIQKPSKFLEDWSSLLKQSLETGKIYGFLDQESFDSVSEKFNVKSIDYVFCNQKLKGLVITGKGQTKFDSTFLNQKSKWD